VNREIFLSYARENREAVAQLGRALEESGYHAVWDRDLGGALPWESQLERKLAKCDCVVVLWSRDSVESEWVRQESLWAAERSVYLAVLIDGTPPPESLAPVHAIDFARWNGDRQAHEFEHLVDGIENMFMTHRGVDLIESAVKNMARSFEGVDLAALANAAEAGDADAQWMLGEGQMHGLGGLAESVDSALPWLMLAAEQGHLDAAQALGLYHFLFIENSSASFAVPWFELAAELGDGYSAWMLSGIYGHGFGDVRKNLLLGRQFERRYVELGYRD